MTAETRGRPTGWCAQKQTRRELAFRPHMFEPGEFEDRWCECDRCGAILPSDGIVPDHPCDDEAPAEISQGSCTFATVIDHLPEWLHPRIDD